MSANSRGSENENRTTSQRPAARFLASERRPQHTWANNFGKVALLGIAWGVWAWLIDRLSVDAYTASLGTALSLEIALCQFFASVLVAGLAGVAVGLVCAVSLGNESAASRWARLCAQNAEAPNLQVQRAARIYAAFTLLAAACMVVLVATPPIVTSVARPGNIAWAFAALVLSLAATFWALFAFARTIWLGVARLAVGTPAGRWLFRSAVRPLLPLSAIVAVAALSLGSRLMPLLAVLDLRAPVTALLALLAALGSFGVLARRAPRWLFAALGAVLFMAFAGGAAAGSMLETTSSSTHSALVEHTTFAWLGVSLVSAALDLDGDGHVNGFADADCAPRDSRIHPGAVELADNGIDENCDGRDLARSTLLSSTGRYDPPPTSWPRRPNLYLVTIDAFAPMALATYGAKQSSAPFLDSLVERSMVFENYFVQGPSTRLSLPAMFTSRFDSEIAREVWGRHPFAISSSNTTVAEVLRDAGYQTFAVLPHPYFGSTNWPGITQGFNVIDEAPARVAASMNEHTARVVTDRALGLLDAARPGAKFLWAHYYDAHPPHTVPDGTAAADERSAYLAEMRYVDGQIRRLITTIRERDPHGVFFVTGDHAIAFDDAKHQRLHYAYDLSTAVLRVPLLVSGSFIEPGKHRPPVSSIDLAPTLTNIAGVERALPFRGLSLVPVLSQHPSESPRWVFSQFYIAEDRLLGRDPLRMVGVRDDRLSMVFDRRLGLVEAWAYGDDRYEARDLWPSAEAATRERLVDMKRVLDAFVSITHTGNRGSSSDH